MKYKGCIDASVHKVRLVDPALVERPDPEMHELDSYFKSHVAIETNHMVKDAHFNIVLEKVQRDSMVDLKSIFEIMSCISFKGTQYKEFRYIRELFRSIDQEYYPRSMKIPISYSFNINFEVTVLPKDQALPTIAQTPIEK